MQSMRPRADGSPLPATYRVKARCDRCLPVAHSSPTSVSSSSTSRVRNIPFASWVNRLKNDSLPAYLQIPDLIAEDLQHGRLTPHYRLPPLRELADLLELNYSTVVRGIAEAR